jgi:hypothetical protein
MEADPSECSWQLCTHKRVRGSDFRWQEREKEAPAKFDAMGNVPVESDERVEEEDEKRRESKRAVSFNAFKHEQVLARPLSRARRPFRLPCV